MEAFHWKVERNRKRNKRIDSKNFTLREKSVEGKKTEGIGTAVSFAAYFVMISDADKSY